MSGDALYLRLDPSGVVVGSLRSPDPQPDGIVASQNLVLVDQPTYDAGRAQVGLCQYVNGALQPYTPPASPAPYSATPTVTGNQWAFALSDLGLSSAWRIGVTKSKDSDQVRVGLIARDTPLVASDPLLIRVAANAGNDSSGNPLVAVPAVFAHAQGMPL